MFLFEIFLSWNADVLSQSFHGLVLKREDLEEAKRKQVAQVCKLSFTGDANKIAAYKHFLSSCERALIGLDEKPFLDFIVNDLMADSDLALSDIEVCDKLTQLFCHNFQNQTNILDIAPMGQAFMAQPNALAAFLRYLLMQGITSEQILSAQLLQDFFLYYCSTLSQAGNPVEKFYNTLRAFPDALPLISLAKKTCCDVVALTSYALDGSDQHAIDSLTKIVSNERIINFTPDKDNLKALHAVFGVNFLMGILYQWDSLKHDAMSTAAIEQLFNQSYTVATQLPDLLNRLHEQPLLQKNIAQILSKKTLMILEKKRVYNILYLISFCPQLREIIQIKDLPIFIQCIRQQSASNIEFISYLFGLYDGFQYNIDAKMLMLDVLLDAFTKDPYARDDARLIGRFRNCALIGERITGKIRALELELDTIIQLNTQAPIETMDCIAIKDVWGGAAENINKLQLIVPIQSTCPFDVYQLYNRLVAAFFNQKNIMFDLDSLIQALGVSLCFEMDNVTICERLLIELLVAIDDNQFRALCVERLDIYTKHPWRERLYNGKSLIMQATLAGNLGLIQWIDTVKIKSPDSYDSLVSSAAQQERWFVVAYFHNHAHKLLQGATKKYLLSMAVTHDVLQIIPSLLGREGYTLPLLDIEGAFKQAVRLNKVESVRCIMSSAQKPSDKVLVAAFKQAIHLNYFDIATVIGEGGTGDVLQTGIDEVFIEAITMNKCDVLTILAIFRMNPPTQNLIIRALVTATNAKQNDIVQSLSRFTCTQTEINFRAIPTDTASSKQSRTTYFQRNHSFKEGVHTMVTRASSCSALTALQHNFFKSVEHRHYTHSVGIITPTTNG